MAYNRIKVFKNLHLIEKIYYIHMLYILISIFFFFFLLYINIYKKNNFLCITNKKLFVL